MRKTNIPETKEKIFHFLNIISEHPLDSAKRISKIKDVIVKYLKDKKIIVKGKSWTSNYLVVRTPTDSEILEAIELKQAAQRRYYSKARGRSQTTNCNIILQDRFVYDAY